jgi:glycosyltransferase involved in cell wall biosynthesis
LKVALVHDWLTGMRGGERCLEAVCEMFPDADICTLLHVKGSGSSTIERHPIRTSFIQHLPLAATRYRYYLPLFPWAIESFDFTGYDLVISLSHCVAKGVQVPERTCHLSYVFTPMRYIWDQYEAYFAKGEADWLTRAAMGIARPWIQQWDVRSSGRVHAFIAISAHVAGRVQRYYGRPSTVVYPPVNWQSFQASEKNEGFYLMVTAFAPYKKVDLAIEAANKLGFSLKIIGQGQDEKRLRRMAGPSVEFLGWQPDSRVRECYSRCLAVLFPGEEDFGIVPLEAMATGKPVIAYGKGGALETVIPLNPLPGMMMDRVSDKKSYAGNCLNKKEGNASEMFAQTDVSHPGPTGVFYYEQSVEALIGAIQLFNRHFTDFDPDTIRRHVEPFDCSHFKQQMQQIIHSGYEEFRHLHPC